jgi:hypothetical protein
MTGPVHLRPDPWQSRQQHIARKLAMFGPRIRSDLRQGSMSQLLNLIFAGGFFIKKGIGVDHLLQ